MDKATFDIPSGLCAENVSEGATFLSREADFPALGPSGGNAVCGHMMLCVDCRDGLWSAAIYSPDNVIDPRWRVTGESSLRAALEGAKFLARRSGLSVEFVIDGPMHGQRESRLKRYGLEVNEGLVRFSWRTTYRKIPLRVQINIDNDGAHRWLASFDWKGRRCVHAAETYRKAMDKAIIDIDRLMADPDWPLPEKKGEPR